MDSTRDMAPMLYRRYLTIFLDGVRADRGPLTPLPVEALTTDQTHTVMTPGSESTQPHNAPDEPDGSAPG
jgi:hypothetical protein